MTYARSQYGACLKAKEFEKWKRNVGKEKGLESQGELAQNDAILSQCHLSLGMKVFRAGARDHEMYSSFTFESLHNFITEFRRF